MPPSETPRNDPTWLEYLIVYIVLGVGGFFLYQSVLAPNGYTFSAAWKALRQKPAPAASPRENAAKPALESADMPADSQTEKTMPTKPPESASPMPAPAPMPAGAPADMPASAPMPLSEEDD